MCGLVGLGVGVTLGSSGCSSTPPTAANLPAAPAASPLCLLHPSACRLCLIQAAVQPPPLSTPACPVYGCGPENLVQALIHCLLYAWMWA